MKLPFYNGSYRDRARPPAIEPPEVGESEPVVEEEALGELDALQVVDETVQEIAEQTSYGEILLDELIRRQLALSLRVASLFLLLLVALPLLNRFAPQLMAVHVLGLPLHWLVLAALVYPLLWALGAYFVATAKKHEDEFTELVRK